MAKNKSKSKIQNWHFVTSLPLEQCCQRLDTWHVKGTSIKITNNNDDSASFEIDFRQRFRQALHTEGKLRRWEGTYTRVDLTLSPLTRAKSYNLIYNLPIMLFLACASILAMSGFFKDGLLSYFLMGLTCLLGVVFVGSSMLWLLTPTKLTDSDLTEARTQLIDYLCHGKSGAHHYLVEEGAINSL